MEPAPSWWQSFFDADYLRLWGAAMPIERTRKEADGLCSVLHLSPGARLLDAPCGYGRLSRELAARGLSVLGVDWSAPLLAAAEAQRGELDGERLRYRRADLRLPLDEGGFDAAINIFSSLGYGSEDDDLAVLHTLHGALVPGGKLFLDTSHRDGVVAQFAAGVRPASRLPDGTLFYEEPRFDAVTGRIDTTWYWQGPSGGGEKSGSLRIYAIPELVRLLARAGFAFVSAHHGCSTEPYSAARPGVNWRVGILATKI